MAAMLLPGMKGSPLLVQRTVTRTIVLQETIGKEFHVVESHNPKKPPYTFNQDYNILHDCCITLEPANCH
ncbi:hypothetical protein STEG23_005349 [Scotinomys teguina]